jgi:polyhydroxybutyrate depolymerase
MLLPLLSLGCRSEEPDPDSPDAPDETAHSGVTGSGGHVPADPSPGCASGAGLADGDHQLLVDGLQREYASRVPALAGPLPLVVDLHGTGGTRRLQQRLSGLDDLAESEGFAIVWPESLELGPVKAFDISCDNADVDFVVQLVEAVGRDVCIDRARTFVTGLSNGGYFSNVLLATHPEVFAAGGPVSSGLGAVPSQCPTTTPRPATFVHGDADEFVDPSQSEDAMAWWSAVNGCTGTDTDAEGCTVGTGCVAPTRHCLGPGATHIDIYARYDTTVRLTELFRAAVP